MKTLLITSYLTLFFCSTFCISSKTYGEPQLIEIHPGKDLYLKNCSSCHGPNGLGNGPAAKAINPRPRNFKNDPFKFGKSKSEIFKTITNGIKGTAMPPWGHLENKKRTLLAEYVLLLSKQK